MASPNFPDLGQIHPNIGPASDVPEKSETEKLLARAETAEAEALAANRALRERSTPAPPAPRAPAPPPQPGEMPDPATDPEGFKTWTAAAREFDRFSSEQNTTVQRTAAENRVASKLIVDGYMTSNPKYKNLRNQVFDFFREASTELGLSEIPDDPAQLDKIVDRKMDELAANFSTPSDDANAASEEANRTAGLSGGSIGGVAGEKPPVEDDGVIIKPLTTVLRERQEKTGLF